MTTSTNVTINLRTILGSSMLSSTGTYRIALETGFVKETDNNFSPSEPRPTLYSFTPTGPNVSSVSPSYGSTNILGYLTTATFDMTIYNGSNTAVRLYKKSTPSDILVKTLSWATDITLNTTNATLTLNLQNLLEPESIYYITISAAAVRNKFNVGNSTIPDDSKIKFTTGAGPEISSTAPAYNATGQYITSATFTFNKPTSVIAAPYSNLRFYQKNLIGGDNLLGTFSNSNTNYVSRLNSTTYKVSNLSDFGIDGATTYYLEMDEGFTKDVIPGINFKSKIVSGDSKVKFTTGDGPKITSTSPDNNTVGVKTSQLIISYNQNIGMANTRPNNTGTFQLYRGNTLVKTYANADSKLTYGAQTVTFNGDDVILYGDTVYHMRATRGAVVGNTKFTSDPINDNSVFKFTTAPGPTPTSWSVASTINTERLTVNMNTASTFISNSPVKIVRQDTGAVVYSTTYPVSTVTSFLLDLPLSGDNAIVAKDVPHYFVSDQDLFIDKTTNFRNNPFSLPFVASATYITSTLPAYNQVNTTASVSITYARTIKKLQTGNVYVYKGATEPGELIDTISAQSGRITTSTTGAFYRTIGVNLANLHEASTYWIEMDDGVFRDRAGYTNNAISDDTKIKFQTNPFYVASTVPANNDQDVYPVSMHIDYNRNYAEVSTSSNFYLYEDNTLITSFKPNSVYSTPFGTNSFTVSFKGGICQKGKTYHIRADRGVAVDIANVGTRPIEDDTVLKFKVNAPSVGDVRLYNNGVIPQSYSWTKQNIDIIHSQSNDVANNTPLGFRVIFNRFYNYYNGQYYFRTLGIANTSSNVYLYDASNNSVAQTKNVSQLSINSQNSNYVAYFDSNYAYKPYNTYYMLADEALLQDEAWLTSDAITNTSTVAVNFSHIIEREQSILSGLTSKVGSTVALSNSGIIFTSKVNATTDQVYHLVSGVNGSRGTWQCPTINKISWDEPGDYGIISFTNLANSIRISNRAPGTTIDTRALLSGQVVGAVKLRKHNSNWNIAVSYLSTATSAPILLWTDKSSLTGSISSTPYELYNSEHHTNSEFGYSIDIKENILAVGSPKQNGTSSTIGKVYVYDLTTKALMYSIENPDNHANDRFGDSVSINGNYLAVSSPAAVGGGKIFLFNLNDGSLVRTMTRTGTTRFGDQVKLMTDYVVITDKTASKTYIYVYRLTDNILYYSTDSGLYTTGTSLVIDALGNEWAFGDSAVSSDASSQTGRVKTALLPNG